MTPPKFEAPIQFTRRTRSTKKEPKPMEHVIRVVYVDDISLPMSDSIIMMLIEDENPHEEEIEVNQMEEGRNPNIEGKLNTTVITL
jgi:hypothetical protein